MFSKRSSNEDRIKTTGSVDKELEQKELTRDVSKDVPAQQPETPARSQNVNKILKGSKLTGDINVTCDLEVSGDVDGNITSMQKSNILIKGVCKGNIETKEGSVDIEGELQGGNITAGKDVKISGAFNGGEVKAGGKIFVDGKFSGTLEGNDIEIGSNSSGKGEIFYKEYISISKGAKVDVHISQAKEALKEVKSPPKTDKADTKPMQQSLQGS
ncbi:polymer-forming cytoskeletal protein [Thermodesulfobacteriota bacterium]